MKKWYDSDNDNYLAIGQDFGNGKCIEIGNSSKSYLTIDKSGIDFGEDSGITLSLKDPTIASSTSQITLREDAKGYLNLGFDLNKKPRLTIYDTETKVGTKFNNSNINHYDDDAKTSYTYSYPSASGTLALTSDIPEIPDTSKFVTTDTNQTITGIKSFGKLTSNSKTARLIIGSDYANRLELSAYYPEFIKKPFNAYLSTYTIRAAKEDVGGLGGYRNLKLVGAN